MIRKLKKKKAAEVQQKDCRAIDRQINRAVLRSSESGEIRNAYTDAYIFVSSCATLWPITLFHLNSFEGLVTVRVN
jgi:hypothetical protein